MGTIWTRELTGGLDSRRMQETAPGGVMIQAQDGHISRGGEFEKRAAFVPVYTLPTGQTQGLAYVPNNLVVFGTADAVAVPTGVVYQKIAISPPQNLAEVPSFDLYSGKLYAVGVYADGSVAHFYDGTQVTDWYDGRSRASFTIISGGITPAVAATGSFEVTGGSSGGGNQITNITIDGVAIITSPVAHTGNNATTAAAVASAINSASTTPDYTATSSGQTVRITAVTAGATINGKAIVISVGGTATVGNIVNMNGGVNALTAGVTDITVNGVSIISAPVYWTTSNSDTAAAIASAIQGYTSSPDYDATSIDDRVNILADAAGVASNGFVVNVTTVNGLVISPASDLTMDGGLDGTTFQPGTYVKTFGSKMYALSGAYLHFSGINEPTKWTTDTTGAGFIDMSSQTSGSEQLQAVAPYQGKLAVFGEASVQIEYVDPDPTLNTLSQALNNTGAVSGRSVTQFGDSDLFYCANNGLRSLRARNATISAATTDIGVPVDDLIIAKLNTLTEQERARIIGLIEPRDGRFWLIMKDIIFVLSYFSGSKVSAWSTYKPGFTITDAVVFNRRVYLRSGDTIYAYGGIGADVQYDSTSAIGQLPFQDAEKPWKRKDWIGVDLAAIGAWELRAKMDPTNRDPDSLGDKVGVFEETTYNVQRNPTLGSSTHISMLFISQGEGYAKVGSLCVHFAGTGEDDDD